MAVAGEGDGGAMAGATAGVARLRGAHPLRHSVSMYSCEAAREAARVSVWRQEFFSSMGILASCMNVRACCLLVAVQIVQGNRSQA